MPLISRSAVLLHDASLRLTNANGLARTLLGHGQWLGKPLSDCVAQIALRGGSGSPVPAGELDGHLRARSGFSLVIGSIAWHAEMTSFPEPGPAAAAGSGPATGALILREGGHADDFSSSASSRAVFLASLSHDLRTPLNAMVGWLHLLSSPRGRDTDLRTRAIAGLQRAVEHQQQLLAHWLNGASGSPTFQGTSLSEQAAPQPGSARDPSTRGRDSAQSQSSVRNRPGVNTTRLGTRGRGDPVHDTVPIEEIRRAAAGQSSSLGGDAASSHYVASAATGTRAFGGTNATSASSPWTGSFPSRDTHTLLDAAIASRHGFDATRATGTAQEERSGLHGVYVLAIDDTPEMLEVLTQVLASDGAVVESVSSAEEALARYPQWAASGGERLVVSDLAMPGRDGISLIREIRAVEREQQIPRLPAVALSAHGVPEVRRRAIEHGYDLFLDKPVSPPAMLTQLHRLLDR